jgi:hypothetical protein
MPESATAGVRHSHGSATGVWRNQGLRWAAAAGRLGSGLAQTGPA